VPYTEAMDAGDRVQVHGDSGTGTVDTATPLMGRGGAALFRPQKRSAGFASAPLGGGVIGTDRAQPLSIGGFGHEAVGLTPIGETPLLRPVTVHVRPAYGVHKFQARVTDGEGNAQGGSLPEVSVMVSSQRPASMGDFSFAQYSGGKVTFNIASNKE